MDNNRAFASHRATDELREKVARALVPLLCGSQEDEFGNDLPDKQFDELTPDWQERHMEYADAAIATVMEAMLPAVWPSERLDDMVRAFDNKIQKHGLRETLMAVVHASLSAFKGTDK